MPMETKSVVISLLLDIYKPMLTEKQQLAMELYVNEDYSLSEIAMHMGASRQAVQDTLKRAQAHLIELENRLQMLHKFTVTQEAITALQTQVEMLRATEKQKELMQKEFLRISAVWEETNGF